MSKEKSYGAPIERGVIETIEDGGYRVASFTRNGITSLPMKTMNEADTLSIGDRVYFFLFDDGDGLIIGKM